MQTARLRRLIRLEADKLANDTASIDALEPAVIAATLQALTVVESNDSVKQRLALVLRTQLTKEWISAGDLLGVFYALSALRCYDKTIPGDMMAHAVQRLVRSEVAPGGPYMSLDKTLSAEANASIVCFLAGDAQLPAAERYAAEATQRMLYDLKPAKARRLIYLVAPALPADARSEVLRIVRKQLAGATSGGNPLEVALLISTLARLDDPAECGGLVDHLAQQLNNRTVVSGRLFAVPIQPRPSSILATALILEALSLCLAASKPKPAAVSNSSYHHEVLQRVNKRLADLPSPLDASGIKIWNEVVQADKNHEIVLMPRFFAESLRADPVTSDEVLAQLGEASFFCWIATIIYDDFIDEEGVPAMLPVANVAHRISLGIYCRLLAGSPGLYDFVEQTYDRVDRANAWELQNTRAEVTGSTITLLALPRYGTRMVLADRAFGHAIGPMLVAMRLPYVRPSQIANAQKALNHYLIARQLNDDLHDWRDDLRAGQLSAVLTGLLRDAGVTPGVYDLDTLTSQLEMYLFRHGLKKQCSQLLAHVTHCRRALYLSGLTVQPGGFGRLVDALEASAREALQIHATRQAFLQSYTETDE